MADITHLFGSGFQPPKPQQEVPHEQQFRDAISETGMIPPDVIHKDGKIHRFSPTGKKKDDAGWYVYFDDRIPAGRFGNWREDINQPWRADIGRDLSISEQMDHKRRIQEARKEAEKIKEKRQETAADIAETIWSGATSATADHPYIKAKGIQPHQCRVTGDGRLIVPMYVDGELTNLQYIDGEGNKKFHGGGSTSGACCLIGEPSSTIVVCEGFADAATIYEQTGMAAIAAFSANNMTATAKFAKTLATNLIIVADNDESGTGEREGRKASEAVGGRFVMPPHKGMDANDYWQSNGDLNNLITPPKDDYLIQADDFCSQPMAIRWLIKGVFQREALIMMHGPSGGGKSFVAIDMVCTIAAGFEDWNGHKVHPGPIVYLAGEGHQGMRARLASWKRHNNAGHLNMWLSKAGTDLNTAEGYNKVRDAINALPEKPAAIVVDTLHRFLAGDENSAQDAKTMIDACAGLMQEFEATILLVHHTGVSDESQHRARGSSAWKGALDLEFSVVPGTEEQPLQFIQRKAKDSELCPPMAFDIQTHELDWIDEDGEKVKSAVLVPAEQSTRVKVDKKAHEDRRLIEKAWWDSGAEDVDGLPYISAAALKRYMLKSGYANTEATAKQYVKPGAKRLVYRLIESGYIVEKMSGFAVTDPIDSGMLIQAKKRG